MNRFLFLLILSFTITVYPQKDHKIINITNKNEVTSITIINDTVWIGNAGGLIARDLKGKIVASYNTTDGLGYNFVSSTALDSTGKKWFSTLGNG